MFWATELTGESKKITSTSSIYEQVQLTDVAIGHYVDGLG
jgi:hypothetical protein